MNYFTKFLKMALIISLLSILTTGCNSRDSDTPAPVPTDAETPPQETEETVNAQIPETVSEESTEDDAKNKNLFEKFLNNEIAASRETGELLFYKDLFDEEEIELNPEPDFYDLDNDGTDEMIVRNWYGGKYFDARDDRIYLFAEGEGTAGVLAHVDYDGNTWIYHCDISHGGREMFWFERYQGADCMVESFSLYDEFWEGKEHTYSLNEKEISMEEYKTLYEDIFQKEYVPRRY